MLKMDGSYVFKRKTIVVINESVLIYNHNFYIIHEHIRKLNIGNQIFLKVSSSHIHQNKHTFIINLLVILGNT